MRLLLAVIAARNDGVGDGASGMPRPTKPKTNPRKSGQQYPTPYSEVALEADYKDDLRLWCDLTFWAVQFLALVNGTDGAYA